MEQQNNTDYSFAALTADELMNLGVVQSAFRSFRGMRRSHLAYVGMPITGGRRYYEVLSREGVRSKEELETKLGPGAYWNLVAQPNIREGTALADRLGSEKDLLFIAPSVFNATALQWSQNAYMSLFYSVIAEMSGSHYVADGWEYSLGGVREVYFSMMLQWRYIRWYKRNQVAELFGLNSLFASLDENQLRGLFEDMSKMRVFGASGKELTIDKIFSMIVTAILDIRSRGFECPEMIAVAHCLKALPVLSPFEEGGPSNWETDTFFEAEDRLRQIM